MQEQIAADQQKFGAFEPVSFPGQGHEFGKRPSRDEIVKQAETRRAEATKEREARRDEMRKQIEAQRAEVSKSRPEPRSKQI
jgi:hypothetical protein